MLSGGIQSGNINLFGKHFPLPRKVVDRQEYILAHCRGRRVLHVGCANFVSHGDWQESVQRGDWLQRQIEAVAAEVVGIDYAKEAVEGLRDRLGYTNIHWADAQHLERLDHGKFDVILAGEVLHHLPNPGLFLESAHAVIAPGGCAIITLANAYCARRFVRVLCGKECTHVDMLAYYSHPTLRRLVELYGWTATEQCNYCLPKSRPLFPYLFERVVCAVSPNVGQGIICRIQQSK